MNNKILLAVVTALAASGLRSQADQTSTYLSEWNIILSGDLQNVTDYNGNAYVGGNLTEGSSFTAAGNDHGGMPPGNYSLAVAGNVSGGGPINVNAGNVVVGGSIAGGRTINMNSHGTVTQGNPAALPTSPVAQIASASQYWSGLAANSSAVISGGNISFNCAANSSIAVFNVTASQLFAQNQNLSITPGSSGQKILINVSGTSATELNSENFNGFSGLANSIVFNFYQATSVALNGSSLNGYVVAPQATVTAVSPIIGGVAAINLNVGSEVELPSGSANYLSAPDLVGVPDGGTTVTLLGLSFAGVGLIRRKIARR